MYNRHNILLALFILVISVGWGTLVSKMIEIKDLQTEIQALEDQIQALEDQKDYFSTLSLQQESVIEEQGRRLGEGEVALSQLTGEVEDMSVLLAERDSQFDTSFGECESLLRDTQSQRSSCFNGLQECEDTRDLLRDQNFNCIRNSFKR